MNEVLIGTGFYNTPANAEARFQMWEAWLKNTLRVTGNIVVVDNAAVALPVHLRGPARIIKCRRNLGHVGDSGADNQGPILGWSMSWIQSALVAYADGCDFVYKEQDCFAFNDWLPLLRTAQMTTGRHDKMPCEQSLFYLAHDFILEFIRRYLNFADSDVRTLPEEKFVAIMDGEPRSCFHELPGGRNRPLPLFHVPFYAQRLTTEEIISLTREGLL